MSEPLPGILAEIEAVAGRDAALMLSWRRWGRRVYIHDARIADGRRRPGRPPGVTAPEPWSALVGDVAAHKIVAHFGGDTLYVPRAIFALVPWLRRHHGMSVADICRDLGVTRRTVLRHL